MRGIAAMSMTPVTIIGLFSSQGQALFRGVFRGLAGAGRAILFGMMLTLIAGLLGGCSQSLQGDAFEQSEDSVYSGHSEHSGRALSPAPSNRWPQWLKWPSFPHSSSSRDADGPHLKEAQACAIGYDLAREVHNRVSLKRTVLLAPVNPSSCERHALDYLRRAGFRIYSAGKDGLGGTGFNVQLARIDADTITATGAIGGTLKITRSYRPVISGVIPTSPPSILILDPNTYTPRKTAKGAKARTRTRAGTGAGSGAGIGGQ